MRGRPSRLKAAFAETFGLELLPGPAEDARLLLVVDQLEELFAETPDKDRAAFFAVLTRLRTAEGYMAESEAQADGSFLLIENHCPICAAAKTCQGFCRSELELFQAAFGADISVTRQEHLLSEGRRCVYRIARQLDEHHCPP